MERLTIFARKGGVGKSSLCLELATLSPGPVLLVDADPQASLSGLLLGGDSAVVALPREETVAGAFDGKPPEPVHIRGNIWLLPGSRHLKSSGRLLLPHFDGLTISDTPPSFTDGIVRECLLGSSHCVSCLLPEPLSVQAAGAATEMFASCAAASNPALRFLGFALLGVRKNVAIHQAVERLLGEMYGSRLLATRIPHSAVAAEASGLGQSACEYAPKSPLATAYRALAAEIDERLEFRRAA